MSRRNTQRGRTPQVGHGRKQRKDLFYQRAEGHRSVAELNRIRVEEANAARILDEQQRKR